MHSRRGLSGAVLTALGLLLVSAPVAAGTGKCRLSWRDDPATSMVIGWVQTGATVPEVY